MYHDSSRTKKRKRFKKRNKNKFVTGNVTAIEKMLKLVKDELTNSLIETETLITSVFE